MIQWRKEPKILLRLIRRMGLIKGAKQYFRELNDLRILGYFKY